MNPRMVIVGIRSAREVGAAWGTAAEFARLFGVSVKGCLYEEPALSELCDLPASFLPRSLARGAASQYRRTMIAALRRETESLRTSLESRAREARVETEFTVAAGRLDQEIGAASSAGDLLVVPLDLSDRPISRQIAEAVRLYPALGGLLFVPAAHPNRTGTILCVSDDMGGGTAEIARRIAAGLHAPLSVTAAEGGGTLDSSVIPAAGLRLIICDARNLNRIRFDGPGSALLSSRASLLVLGGSDDSSG